MKGWSFRQVLALVLGGFLALGTSLSAVQASDMAAQMAMAGDTGVSGQGNRGGCGGSGGDDGALTCSPVLTCSSMAAVLPVERCLVAVHATEVFIAVSSVAGDLIAPPDPYPPRPRDLD